MGLEVMEPDINLITQFRLIWLYQGRVQKGQAEAGERGICGLIIMEAKLGELGNWSEMKVLKKRGVQNAAGVWPTVMSMVMPLAELEEEPFDGEDEELGVRGSELEVEADRSCRGVQNTQGKGLHPHVALINIGVGDI